MWCLCAVISLFGFEHFDPFTNENFLGMARTRSPFIASVFVCLPSAMITEWNGEIGVVKIEQPNGFPKYLSAQITCLLMILQSSLYHA